MTASITLQDLRIHGVYAEDVVYLRDLGMTVAPFKGAYRVGNEIVEKAALHVFAKAERTRRGQKQPPARAAIVKAAPRAATAAPAAAVAGPTSCPCGQPSSHSGRCWHRRGQPNPALAPPQARVLSTGSMEARVAQLERQVKGLLRILGAQSKSARVKNEERAQSHLKFEAEIAQL